MVENNQMPVEQPSADVGEELATLIKVTGTVQSSMGGYRILVHHAGAFPWEKVFKALVYRGFRVYVSSRKADLEINAEP
jgi:hypothetical protein